MQPIINNRSDLDALVGTEYHVAFMQMLKGTMTRKQDVAVRPSNYGQSDYIGPEIPAVWQEVKDLSTITAFGFTEKDFK